jgi:AAA+ superfamily predicted ATPase
MRERSGRPAQPTTPPEALGGGAAALADALLVLDAVLGAAVDTLARRLGPATLLDPWRGMHLEREDVDRLLAGQGRCDVGTEGVAGWLAQAARRVPPLQCAAAQCGLSDADLAVLLITLAPEVDLKYCRVYGYLQDDLARRRASPDLAANLLACNAQERLLVLARLDADAPLRSAGIVGPGEPSGRPWIAEAMAIEPIWLRWLLGREVLDPALDTWGRVQVPPSGGLAELALGAELEARVQAFMHAGDDGPRLLLSGPHGAGKLALARAIAHECGQRVLVVDVRGWASGAEVESSIRRAALAGRLGRAIVYLHGLESLARRDVQLTRSLFEAVAGARAKFVMASKASISPTAGAAQAVVRIELDFPPAAAREACWRRALAARGLRASPQATALAASRFAMGASQIEQAALDECLGTASPDGAVLDYAMLAAAARAQCGAQLGGLAQRVAPAAGLATLVLAPDLQAQLREICARVATREAVRSDWAAGSVHARVIGVTALFCGPSGTGKTLAAEAIAHELGYDMYRIDLASIVSKYIGETEQNLDRVFAAAEHANAVLFFDEADALFGKRSAVKDAHDRYANIEVAYLLQKMEQFDGLAILASNLKQNLDEAFARRLTFSVNFPFPEQAHRRQLWESLWPPKAPRGADIDFDWLAREYRLSGGHIRNALLAAAHLAAADGRVVTRAHVLHATRREFQKLGKTIGVPEVAP